MEQRGERQESANASVPLSASRPERPGPVFRLALGAHPGQDGETFGRPGFRRAFQVGSDTRVGTQTILARVRAPLPKGIKGLQLVYRRGRLPGFCPFSLRPKDGRRVAHSSGCPPSAQSFTGRNNLEQRPARQRERTRTVGPGRRALAGRGDPRSGQEPLPDHSVESEHAAAMAHQGFQVPAHHLAVVWLGRQEPCEALLPLSIAAELFVAEAAGGR
jgi:hypothetical protein